MKRESYPMAEIRESLLRLEGETNRLMELSKGIPGIEKNISPIVAFIDILKFHLDVDDEDLTRLDRGISPNAPCPEGTHEPRR